MASVVTGSRAWGASIAVHGAIVLLLALFLGAGHHHDDHDDRVPPTRLVWVEPAPPARGSPAVAAGGPVVPPVEPPVTAPAVRAASKAVTPPVPVLGRSGTARPAPQPRARIVAPPAPEIPPAVADSNAGEVAGGGERGVAGGVTGGVTGGLGTAPLALSAVATPPELLERVVPEYPARARALEIEGQVVLEVVLDERGRPETDIRVLRSVAQLDAVAVTAVRQWRFRPARDAAGKAVRVVMEVPVRFVLR